MFQITHITERFIYIQLATE